MARATGIPAGPGLFGLRLGPARNPDRSGVMPAKPLQGLRSVVHETKPRPATDPDAFRGCATMTHEDRIDQIAQAGRANWAHLCADSTRCFRLETFFRCRIFDRRANI